MIADHAKKPYVFRPSPESVALFCFSVLPAVHDSRREKFFGQFSSPQTGHRRYDAQGPREEGHHQRGSDPGQTEAFEDREHMVRVFVSK